MKNKLTEQQKVNEILSRILTNILTRSATKTMNKLRKDRGIDQTIDKIEKNLSTLEQDVIRKFGKDSDQYKSIFDK